MKEVTSKHPEPVPAPQGQEGRGSLGFSKRSGNERSPVPPGCQWAGLCSAPASFFEKAQPKSFDKQISHEVLHVLSPNAAGRWSAAGWYETSASAAFHLLSFGHCPNRTRPQRRGNVAEKTTHPTLRQAGFLSVPTAYRTPQVKMFSAESKRIPPILLDNLFSSVKCN